ncbi:hypothetical protein Tco_0438317 [Tanacetum coccineum]
MVINSPCLTDKKELAIPGQTATGKEFSNPLMADSLPKTILSTKYALTANPTIYVSLVEQFWQTATIKTVNDREQQITVTVDGHKFTITEASVRRHLQLADVDGLSSLPNTEIFKQLSLMGVKDQQSLLSPNTHPLLLHHLHHNPLHLNQHPHKHHLLMNLLLNLSLTLHLHIHKKHKFDKQHLPCPMIYLSQEVAHLGSMKLKELTNLCTKLVARVTSLETELKKTKEVHGKALTKLVKKVERLEDKLKSTNKRKNAKMVISDEEEELVSEDYFKQGRMEETEYADVEEENAGVEYDFDLTEQHVTPLKALQVELQSQETFKVELSVLSAAKILAETSKERLAKKVQEEEQTKVFEQQEQERANLEAALNLQKQFDQERKAVDDIDWSKIVDQAQERQSGSMIRYHSFKKKPVTVGQARKNMMVYLKNMANYKMKYFKGMSYDQIRPIFEEEYRKVQTLFKKDSKVSKSEKKIVVKEALLQESFKKLRTTQASGSEPFHQEKSTEEPKELSKEDLKKMLEIVPVEEFKVEALQTKYPIIDWEIHTEGSRKYWKIIRVGNITEAYQGFEDMLKAFNREDLDTL